MHVLRTIQPRQVSILYLVLLLISAPFAALLGSATGASAVTPVTAGCSGTTGNMAQLAAEVAAVTTGNTAEIDLVAGCTYTFDATTPGPLTVAQGVTLTIEGNGATISGAAAGAIVSGAWGGSTPSTVTVDNVTFSGNSSFSGGAIYNETYGSTLHITNSTFSNNSAQGGGAIYTNGGVVTIDNSTFTSNKANIGYGEGGAIFNSGGTVTINTTTLSLNAASGGSQYVFGGAIYNTGSLNITNSTFSGNTSTNWGGAINNYGGTQVIRNTTFSGNTAANAGGAIYSSFNFLTVSGNLFVANKVGAAVVSCTNYSLYSFTDQGYNVADDASCFNPGNGNVTTTAALIGLGSLAPNGGPTQTMAITSTSAAYHAVAAAKCPATDQRGHPRLALSSSFCDAGAFEVDAAVTTTPITVTVNGSQTYGDASPTLTYTASGGPVAGTVSCTGLSVTGNGIVTPTAVSATLGAATGYTLAVTGCSGLTTDANHTISYTGGTFDVGQATIDVTVTGSQTYGGSPSFSYPHAAGVTGTAVCSTVNSGTPIASTLAASGSYTLDGANCSGVSVTDATNTTLSLTGGAFTVGQATIDVTVTGSQTYGGSPSFTYPATAGVTGTAVCSTVNSGTPIASTLAAGGSYTLDGANCLGVSVTDSTNTTLSLTGGAFTVAKATIDVTVTGSQTYGGSPSFSYPATAGVTGTAVCSTVNSGTPITSTLTAGGSYTLDGANCSGVSVTDTTNTTLSLTGGAFTVGKATINVTVTGSQTYGGSPSFSYPATAGVTGTAVCSTVNGGTPIVSTLAAGGAYTLDGANCSGVGVTDATNTTLSLTGSAFTVGKATIDVTVTGSQTYGGSPSFSYPATAGVTGTAVCSTVNGGTPIVSTLAAGGAYTLDGANCSGVSVTDATNTTLSLTGGAFTVGKATIDVTVTGSQTYGGSSSFSYPATAGVTGTAVCSTVNSGTPITSTLTAGGSYTLDGANCSGVSVTDATNTTLSLTGGAFTVAKATISVTVTGSQTYGGSPSFSYPPTAGVTGTAVCSTVNSGTPITSTLAAGGAYTLDGANCSGVSVTDATNTTLALTGGAFTVAKATISVTVTGSQTYGGSPSFSYPATAGVTGTAVCSTVNGGTPITSTLTAGGAYTLDGATCSGIAATDPANYMLSITGTFTVAQATIDVTVNGLQAYGSSTPVLTYTSSGGSVSGSVSCAALTANGAPVGSGLAAGTYTLGFTSCSGLTPTGSSDYTIAYTAGSFVVTSNLFESDTSCQDYLAGSGAAITTLRYGVKGGQINNVAPGVVSYYTKFAASGVTGGVTITQAVGSGGRLFQTLHSQVMVYDSNCNRVPARQVSITESNGTIVVTVAGLNAGSQYVVSVKYNANGAVGVPVGQPSPTFTYSFSDDAGGAGSLALKPKS